MLSWRSWMGCSTTCRRFPSCYSRLFFSTPAIHLDSHSSATRLSHLSSFAVFLSIEGTVVRSRREDKSQDCKTSKASR